MESMTNDTHTEGSDANVPLIKDYNNITPSEITNILKILTHKSNDNAPKEKKRKSKNVNVNYNPEFIKKPHLQENPECYIKLQSELNTNPMINTRKKLRKTKSELNVNCSGKGKGMPSKIISVSNLTTGSSSSRRKQNISRHTSKLSKDINNIDLNGVKYLTKITNKSELIISNYSKTLHPTERQMSLSEESNYINNSVNVPNKSCDSPDRLCNLNAKLDNLPRLNNKTILLTDSQSNKCTVSTEHFPLPCVTLDSSDEEVISQTHVQDCYSSRVKNPITTSKPIEEEISIKDDESIVLSDSEESVVEFIPGETCDITEIKIVNVQSVRAVEEDVTSVRTVEEDAQSVSTVEEDAQSVSTVEDDFTLRKWRDELKNNNTPCIVVSSDDEIVYECQQQGSVFNNEHFFSDDLKTSFDCPVCLKNITNCTYLSSTVCGHYFCTNCIIKSVENYKKCPTCDYNLEQSLVHPVFLNFN